MTDRMLPVLDEEPEEWGPDHDELGLTDEELGMTILLGNLMGEMIEIDDDHDNGLSSQ